MSHRLQDLFWNIDLSSTEQLVAQRLAWHADDATGKCWPGIASLCAKTGLKERAVQMAIKSLREAGHITREEARGLGVVYFVHPRTTCAPRAAEDVDVAQSSKPTAHTPASDAPPTPAEPPHTPRPRTECTPAPDAPTPALNAPKQVKNPSDVDGDAGAAAERTITGQRGRRIDPDWQPTRPLPEPIAKVVAGWPPGRLAEQLESFRDFWLADAGQRASKHDWDRTWWNRLRAITERDRQRDERSNRHGERSDHRPGPRRQGQFRDPLLAHYADGGDPGVG